MFRLVLSFLFIASTLLSQPFMPAKVVRIVDGDTLIADVERYGETKRERVRLIGIDTPEIHHPSRSPQPYGLEAKRFAERYLQGKQVFLELDIVERDPFGRLLAYVWTEKPDRVGMQEIKTQLFNSRLLIVGYAQVMSRPPNGKYNDFFLSYQRDAQDHLFGIWGGKEGLENK